LSPAQAADRIKLRGAVLVDIRGPDEFRRRHVKGALSRTLSAFVVFAGVTGVCAMGRLPALAPWDRRPAAA
jgi:rhodanese-related sulfurtransferase